MFKHIGFQIARHLA